MSRIFVCGFCCHVGRIVNCVTRVATKSTDKKASKTGNLIHASYLRVDAGEEVLSKHLRGHHDHALFSDMKSAAPVFIMVNSNFCSFGNKAALVNDGLDDGAISANVDLWKDNAVFDMRVAVDVSAEEDDRTLNAGAGDTDSSCDQ